LTPSNDDSCSDRFAWSDFRRQMPIARQWAYFDHAAVAPLSEPARQAVSQWADEAAVSGDTAWPAWARKAEELRARLAELIGASTDEIALARNTTEGINFVAEGFPWQRGDNVVTLADEFPSNQYAWINLAERGVQTRRVAVREGTVDFEAIAQACDDRTRLLAVSWVGYCSGWRNNLEQLAKLAHARGALLMVDAIQALGVVPLDVRNTPVDFLAADGHKWLLGPEGAGVFFARREHLQQLRPLGLGWHSVVHDHDFTRIDLNLKPSAARYEGGSQNMVGALALLASLEFMAGFGTEAICRQIFAVTDLACQRLEQIGARIRSDRSPEHKSGIVIFDFPGRDPRELRARCLERGVVLSCRAGGLRISPHAYNNASDIDRLIDALKG
jgi:cysteine desulfurase / selenocysteine lyase